MSEGCGLAMKGRVGKVCKWACEWKAWFHARGRKENVCAVGGEVWSVIQVAVGKDVGDE